MESEIGVDPRDKLHVFAEGDLSSGMFSFSERHGISSSSLVDFSTRVAWSVTDPRTSGAARPVGSAPLQNAYPWGGDSQGTLWHGHPVHACCGGPKPGPVPRRPKTFRPILLYQRPEQSPGSLYGIQPIISGGIRDFANSSCCAPDLTGNKTDGLPEMYKVQPGVRSGVFDYTNEICIGGLDPKHKGPDNLNGALETQPALLNGRPISGDISGCRNRFDTNDQTLDDLSRSFAIKPNCSLSGWTNNGRNKTKVSNRLNKVPDSCTNVTNSHSRSDKPDVKKRFEEAGSHAGKQCIVCSDGSLAARLWVPVKTHEELPGSVGIQCIANGDASGLTKVIWHGGSRLKNTLPDWTNFTSCDRSAIMHQTSPGQLGGLNNKSLLGTGPQNPLRELCVPSDRFMTAKWGTYHPKEHGCLCQKPNPCVQSEAISVFPQRTLFSSAIKHPMNQPSLWPSSEIRRALLQKHPMHSDCCGICSPHTDKTGITHLKNHRVLAQSGVLPVGCECIPISTSTKDSFKPCTIQPSPLQLPVQSWPLPGPSFQGPPGNLHIPDSTDGWQDWPAKPSCGSFLQLLYSPDLPLLVDPPAAVTRIPTPGTPNCDTKHNLGLHRDITFPPISDQTTALHTALLGEIDEDAEERESRRYKCPYCQVACNNNGQLKGHLRVHTGEKPYQCDCGRAFARNEELTRHRRIHSGLRPHQCKTCGKRFGRKDHLNKHQKTHLRTCDKKVHACHVAGCRQRYTRSDALARHQWGSHGIRPKTSRLRPPLTDDQPDSKTSPV